MKSRFLICFTAIAFFVALSIPASLAAQEHPTTHHKYKLIDIGTFGGPNSGVPTVFNEINGLAGARAISNQGTVAGTGDTSTPDSLCFFDDCFYPNAFQWRNGVLTNLSTLANSPWSAASWISGSGLISGFSENGGTDPLTGTPEVHAVSWQDGQITDMGTLPGGYESFAWGINDRGRGVGMAHGSANVPPRVPRSCIFFVSGSHRNRCVVGSPVRGFTVEFV